MVLRKPFRTQPPLAERRSGRDRRQVDKGPPGGRDRRVNIEPRRPEVVELEVSVSEWLALQEATSPIDSASPAEAVAAASTDGPVGPARADRPAAARSAQPAQPAQPAEPVRATRPGRVR